jgi:hypothetical protein
MGIDEPAQSTKAYLPSLVLLPHHHVEFLAPALIRLAEAAVAIAVGVGLAILLPKQLQGHMAMGPELLVDRGEVRWRFLRPQLGFRARIQDPFQASVIPAIRERPAYLGLFSAFPILMHRTDGNGTTASDLTLVEFPFVSKS